MAESDGASTWRSALPEPTAEEIRAVLAGMTRREAAALAGTSTRAVDEWVGGRRRPDSARWEIILLRLDRHPALRLVPRRR